MTPLHISIAASIASILLILVVLELIRSRRLRERYALLWLATGVVLLVLSAWRGGLNTIAGWLGVDGYPPAVLFAVATLFILAVLLHYSTVISKLADQNTILAQRVALLERRVAGRGGDAAASRATGEESATPASSATVGRIEEPSRGERGTSSGIAAASTRSTRGGESTKPPPSARSGCEPRTTRKRGTAAERAPPRGASGAPLRSPPRAEATAGRACSRRTRAAPPCCRRRPHEALERQAASGARQRRARPRRPRRTRGPTRAPRDSVRDSGPEEKRRAARATPRRRAPQPCAAAASACGARARRDQRGATETGRRRREVGSAVSPSTSGSTRSRTIVVESRKSASATETPAGPASHRTTTTRRTSGARTSRAHQPRARSAATRAKGSGQPTGRFASTSGPARSGSAPSVADAQRAHGREPLERDRADEERAAAAGPSRSASGMRRARRPGTRRPFARAPRAAACAPRKPNSSRRGRRRAPPRLAVRHGRVPDDLALEPGHVGDELGEFADRDLDAGAEVDGLGAVVALRGSRKPSTQSST